MCAALAQAGCGAAPAATMAKAEAATAAPCLADRAAPAHAPAKDGMVLINGGDVVEGAAAARGGVGPRR
jgi:hypothetical protein